MIKQTKKRQLKIKNNTKNTYKKLICSPNTDSNDKNNFSCYSNSSLIKIRDIWNIKYPENKIISNNPYTIWLKLKKKFENICNSESCWLKQKFIEGGINTKLIESFAPQKPTQWIKNPNEWLSSLDIERVLQQYEKSYKCFEFIGPSPIDYFVKEDNKCVWEELCKFNLKNQIDKKKTKIGIIFNLDPHYKSGSHWVSLFINIPKKYIFYFDSVGDNIPNYILKFVNCVIEQGKKLNPPIYFNFDLNHPFVHQEGNTECGMYSLYFILSMLKDTKTPNYFKKNKITDKQVEKYRNIYFNESL